MEKKKYYLLHLEMNEDVKGWNVCESDSYILERINSLESQKDTKVGKQHLGQYLGSGRQITCSVKKFLESISKKEISQSEYETIKNLIGSEYGILTPRDFVDAYEIQLDWDDDDDNDGDDIDCDCDDIDCDCDDIDCDCDDIDSILQ